MTLNKEAQEKISQLQLMEQALSNLTMQKQQTHAKVLEIETALKELSSSSESFKIVGNIMIKSDAETLTKELTEDKEKTEIRVKALEKQETATREKAKKIQEEVLSLMESNETKED